MVQISDATRQFISDHRTEDTRKLALQTSRFPDVDMPFALDQIAGWQAARTKLPSWAATDGIIYPPHLSMEQCSSELTARYKGDPTPSLPRGGSSKRPNDDPTSSLPRGGSSKRPNTRFVDLTGGFGVDFYWMSQGFQERIYVEQNAQLCAISSNNFKRLGLEATVVNADAVEYLRTMPPADVVYLDPARRDAHGGRTYSIADCTPNILEIRDLLTAKAQIVVIKLSPMLDWRKAVQDLGEGFVQEIHIVSVDNECKELVVVQGGQGVQGVQGVQGGVKMVCVNLFSKGGAERFEVLQPSTLNPQPSTLNPQPSTLIPQPSTLNLSLPSQGRLGGVFFLYEPNASIMKAGCFDEIAAYYRVSPLARNSHLFVSDTLCNSFPGRRFEIVGISSMNKKELRKALAGMEQANITVRNFPLTVAELRKRLKLKDGGDVYLFATTLAQGEHVLIIAKKTA